VWRDSACANRLRGIVEAENRLIATEEQVRLLREGVATVICRAPKVGKSSPLNVLLGFERAIVSKVAGAIHKELNCGGVDWEANLIAINKRRRRFRGTSPP